MMASIQSDHTGQVEEDEEIVHVFYKDTDHGIFTTRDSVFVCSHTIDVVGHTMDDSGGRRLLVDVRCREETTR